MIKLLPKKLRERYKSWKKLIFPKQKDLFKKLHNEGQKPIALIVSCSDSRVHATSLLGLKPGEFFIHRNIANLIPKYNLKNKFQATTAVLEYACLVLKVPHIIILGHSKCGGIKTCCELFSENNDVKKKLPHISSWLQILEKPYNEIIKDLNIEKKIKILEKKSIINSIYNLYSYPFIKKRIDKNELAIHGLFHEIKNGNLYQYNPKSNLFELM